MHRDLSDKAVVAVLCLDGRSPQGLAVTDQLVQTACPPWDLADHPGLEHLAEFLQVGLVVAVRLPRSGTGRGTWHPTASA